MAHKVLLNRDGKSKELFEWKDGVQVYAFYETYKGYFVEIVRDMDNNRISHKSTGGFGFKATYNEDGEVTGSVKYDWRKEDKMIPLPVVEENK